MNGKCILSVKDGGMVSLSDAFCPTWHNQGLFLKYRPMCLCRPISVDIGCGILQALVYSTLVYRAASYLKIQEHCLPCKSHSHLNVTEIQFLGNPMYSRLYFSILVFCILVPLNIELARCVQTRTRKNVM